jgi:magnesium chelatase subunit D
MQVIYPFTAIVGQERMKRALILNAVHPLIGGVLIRGERGTAKSTAARGLAALLPAIEAVDGCPFACNLDNPLGLCHVCEGSALNGELKAGQRNTPFIDLPVSATEDRVVGTLDIEKAIRQGERHFEPGILAAANRGILYVDEVNLLDDHVVDLLLDSAAMGVNVVEREGISVQHPARFVLVGSMNPEEGDLRPQLLDRFAHAVDVVGIDEPRARVEILRRRTRFEQDADRFSDDFADEAKGLGERIIQARRGYDRVTYSDTDLYTIAALTSSFNVDGHRADLVILNTARAQAAFEGRDAITDRDILMSAELALPHRMKKQPFQDTALQPDQLEANMRQARAEAEENEEAMEEADGDAATTEKKSEEGDDSEELDSSPESGEGGVAQPDAAPQQSSSPGDEKGARKPVDVGEVFEARKLDTPLDKMTREKSGKRSYSRTDRKRGRYIKARPAQDKFDDVAFDATLRNAAPYQKERHESGESDLALQLRMSDLQRKIRVRRTGNLILFVVDASWSMAASERMEATKGAIFSLLVEAYQRRDQVGLVVFQRDKARVVLPPTNSVELAERALQDLPVGGKTPLSSGLLATWQVVENAQRRDPELRPLVMLLTDGAGNVSMTGMPAQEEAMKMASLFDSEDVRTIVINMEHMAFDRGLAQALAEQMGGVCYNLPDLRADTLLNTVKREIGG